MTGADLARLASAKPEIQAKPVTRAKLGKCRLWPVVKDSARDTKVCFGLGADNRVFLSDDRFIGIDGIVENQTSGPVCGPSGSLLL